LMRLFLQSCRGLVADLDGWRQHLREYVAVH
jgi:hypothetical protein